MNNKDLKSSTTKLVTAALLAALIFLATSFFKIPSPLKGYINLGDCVVLLAAWILPPRYSFFAAGVGSALADILGGFVVYAPVTFIIKGCMALIAYWGFHKFDKKFGNTWAWIIGGILAELLMIGGYYIFEAVLYGWEVSLVNIPINGVQGLAGLVIGVILIKVLSKQRVVKFL